AADPAPTLPTLVPAVAEAVHDIGAVGMKLHAAAGRDGGEAFDRGRELHALIGGVALRAAHHPLVVALDDDGSPPTGAGIAATCTIRLEDDVGSGRRGQAGCTCQYRYRPQLSQCSRVVACFSSWMAWGRMVTRQPPQIALAFTGAMARPLRALRMRS